jgi:hypothetical protein
MRLIAARDQRLHIFDAMKHATVFAKLHGLELARPVRGV